jgi:hypothetical protein
MKISAYARIIGGDLSGVLMPMNVDASISPGERVTVNFVAHRVLKVRHHKGYVALWVEHPDATPEEVAEVIE